MSDNRRTDDEQDEADAGPCCYPDPPAVEGVHHPACFYAKAGQVFAEPSLDLARRCADAVHSIAPLLPDPPAWGGLCFCGGIKHTRTSRCPE